MSIYTFKNDQGETFTVKGPPELTQAQAQEIFDKQSDSGSLVGLTIGGLLSAASQAAKGFVGALSSLGQQASGIIGALGGSISSAAGQIGSVASKTLSSANSIASKAVSSVSGALSTPSTNGINLADYSKQATALAPIGGLNVAETTGVLAQTKQLVGQASNTLTNTKGIGAYGFDIKQLETAGYLKPGTSAKASALVASGTDLTSLISKSPNIFTGKGGVTDINGILSNPGLQDKIQQDLMAVGAAGLKTVGIATDALSSSSAAGLLMSASKSLPDTEAFVKGLPLPASVAADIKTNIVEGAFATNLTDTKVPEAFKEEIVPVPATDTTNRTTLDAASKRIIGNSKIPVPDYGPPDDVNGFA